MMTGRFCEMILQGVTNFEHSITSMMTEENSQYDSLIGCEPDNLSGILAPITGVIENMEI